jgi:ABC-type uncharacterized transport system permease subunit
MTSALFTILATVLYLSAAGLLWRSLSTGKTLHGGARTGVFALAAGALALHAALLYIDLFQGGLNLGLTNAAALVAWAVTLLFLTAALFQPIESLGTLILPVAAAMLLLEWLWPTRHLALPGASPAQAAHIVISLLAYSLLSVAVVQSLVLGLQERALHRRHAGGFLRSLPPLETMEHLLFRMIAVGFALLTLTLVSGVFFSEELFGKPLRFTHHIVLSIIAWVIFGMLLTGRRLYGWRGRTAVRWTLAGFSLLVLGYFGSKFVLEVLLGRAS